MTGCISSEGTGGKSKEGPERSVGPIDTSRAVAPSSAVVEKKASAAQANRPSRSTKFKAKQDTLKTSIVRKNKTPLRLPKIVRPENPAFTVQIGAFARPNNALRNQKLAKTRFPEYPVYNNFLAQAKIYRVSVGKFDTRRDALAAQKQILKKCPKEYTGCWINYIRK
jgi:cell division septation protein DedD